MGFIRSFLILFLVAILHVSCAITAPYNTSEYLYLPHESVMESDFPTKNSVFLKFGSPTKKDSIGNVVNWYFHLGEISTTKSSGYASGTGKIYSRHWSYKHQAIIRQSSIIKQNSYTVTKESFVQFWFIGDTVIKWESIGVDYSRPYKNFFYNPKKRQEIEDKRNLERILSGSIFGLVLAYIAFWM